MWGRILAGAVFAAVVLVLYAMQPVFAVGYLAFCIGAMNERLSKRAEQSGHPPW